jgi:hypothetical protein
MVENLLICTELDRTLIPNGPWPESLGARKRFADFVIADIGTNVYRLSDDSWHLLQDWHERIAPD